MRDYFGGVGAAESLEFSVSDAALIIKDILLHDAPNAFVAAVRETAFIMLFQYLTDMGVHRECIQMMQGKKTDTIRHFFSHTKEF